MMDNAEWREEQRARNVSRYVEEEQREDAELSKSSRGKDDDNFIA